MMKPFDFPRKLAAEFLAVTLYVFVGCGTIVASRSIDTFNMTTMGTSVSMMVATAVAFGFGITVLMYAIGHISGGHINPAVTTSLFLIGEIDAVTAGAYVLIQMLAGVIGATLLWGCVADDFLRESQNDDPPFLLGSNFVTPELPMGSAFVIEAVGTFFWVWAFCMTFLSKSSMAGNIAPIAVGWAVLVAHLVLLPFTTCGINPARSFGPHLVVIMAGEKVGYEGWWVYYTGPFVGGAVAALCYKFIFTMPEEMEGEMPAQMEAREESHEDEVKDAPDQPVEVGSA